MIYLAPSGCQSLQRVGGLWGPALLSREDCFLKSCPYLAMLHHVCVPDLRIPQQPPRGPLRSLKGAVGGQTPAALSHVCPLFTSLSTCPGQGSPCLELSHHIRGDGWKQAPALFSVLALAPTAAAVPSQETINN